LRGEFLPLMIGEHNYNLCKQLKFAWDPNNVFNANKIVNTPPMTTQLRYEPNRSEREIGTIFNFSAQKGILRAIENCNGAADCRKSEIIGGSMCPSYMATRNENASTRARANILREYLTNSTKDNPFDHKEIYDILDLCLSCKACKSECPSNVDMAKLKAEFLQHYYDANGTPIRSVIIANITRLNRIFSYFPFIYNSIVSNKHSKRFVNKIIGFSKERSLPKMGNTTLKKWIKKNITNLNNQVSGNRKVWFFIDEFTNYNDVETGIISIKLLNKLGYYINIKEHNESGRTFLSKGFVRNAKVLANQNISTFADIITNEVPLVGIEPSCILTFRDEYPELVDEDLRATALELGKNALFIDEFLAKEFEKGTISAEQFTKEPAMVKFHGHCQQKALISSECTRKILSIPVNYSVTEIKSGCCGMAGSFGYEKEHYKLSMKIGEMVLFPEVRNANENTLLAAPGTSCRHHIADGTGKKAVHPVEILYNALILKV
jgi:Fe-S oxidoreductase